MASLQQSWRLLLCPSVALGSDITMSGLTRTLRPCILQPFRRGQRMKISRHLCLAISLRFCATISPCHCVCVTAVSVCPRMHHLRFPALARTAPSSLGSNRPLRRAALAAAVDAGSGEGKTTSWSPSMRCRRGILANGRPDQAITEQGARAHRAWCTGPRRGKWPRPPRSNAKRHICCPPLAKLASPRGIQNSPFRQHRHRHRSPEYQPSLAV